MSRTCSARSRAASCTCSTRAARARRRAARRGRRAAARCRSASAPARRAARAPAGGARAPGRRARGGRSSRRSCSSRSSISLKASSEVRDLGRGAVDAIRRPGDIGSTRRISRGSRSSGPNARRRSTKSTPITTTRPAASTTTSAATSEALTVAGENTSMIAAASSTAALIVTTRQNSDMHSGWHPAARGDHGCRSPLQASDRAPTIRRVHTPATGRDPRRRHRRPPRGPARPARSAAVRARPRAGRECATAAESDTLLYRTRPDVVLVDYHLPGTDGLTLCRRIKSDVLAPAVVLYSAFADPSMTVPAIVAGVDAIVHKGGQTRDLFDAIRRTARGETSLPEISGRCWRRPAMHSAPTTCRCWAC